jgi:hypothetical protein
MHAFLLRSKLPYPPALKSKKKRLLGPSARAPTLEGRTTGHEPPLTEQMAESDHEIHPLSLQGKQIEKEGL